MFRYRDPQPQVTENYPYLLNLSTHICKSCYLDTQLDTQFVSNNGDFGRLIKQIKNDNSRDQRDEG